jgi:hypothetical protein
LYVSHSVRVMVEVFLPAFVMRFMLCW